MLVFRHDTETLERKAWYTLNCTTVSACSCSCTQKARHIVWYRDEAEVDKTKHLYDQRMEKLSRMGEFLEKNRQLIKAGNKGLSQVSFDSISSLRLDGG